LSRRIPVFILLGLLASIIAFVPFASPAWSADRFTWGEWTYTEGQFLRRAIPPMPLAGASLFAGPEGQWFRLVIVPNAKPEPIAPPQEGAALGLPGKPFFWGPWMISSGRRLRVLFPFPEYQEGGYMVDTSGKWFAWDDAKKRLRFVKPLEGYVDVKPGK